MLKHATLQLETVEGTGLRFACQSGHVTFTLDSGPDVTSPSPVQALLCAAGACTGMDVISILRKKRQHVTGYTIALEGTRRDEHPRSFTAIRMVHRLRGVNLSVPAVEEAIRLSETKYCSVVNSLRPGVDISSHFEIEPAEATP